MYEIFNTLLVKLFNFCKLAYSGALHGANGNLVYDLPLQ